MNRVIALLTLVVATALLGAGCGGGGGAKPLSKSDYVAQMTAIGKDLSTSLNTMGSATTAKTAATGLAKVQIDLRAAAKKIEAIKPPDDVKAAHEQLAKGVSDFADELDPIIVKVKGGNLSALTSLTSLKGLKDIQTAAAAITKAGYKIGG
jgi:soluble cytochrome b562